MLVGFPEGSFDKYEIVLLLRLSDGPEVSVEDGESEGSEDGSGVDKVMIPSVGLDDGSGIRPSVGRMDIGILVGRDVGNAVGTVVV